MIHALFFAMALYTQPVQADVIAANGSAVEVQIGNGNMYGFNGSGFAAGDSVTLIMAGDKIVDAFGGTK